MGIVIMSKNKVHYARGGFVIGVGEIPGSTNFVLVEGDEVLVAINAGKTVTVVDGQVVIAESRATKWSEVRAARDYLLAESDVEILRINDREAISGDINMDMRQSLALYRQSLRDITTQENPFDITWPVWSQI